VREAIKKQNVLAVTWMVHQCMQVFMPLGLLSKQAWGGLTHHAQQQYMETVIPRHGLHAIPGLGPALGMQGHKTYLSLASI